MNAATITALIESELQADAAFTAAYGEGVNRYRIDPLEERYHNASPGGSELLLWTVLVIPGGHVIFYDPEENNFGLGFRDKAGKLHYFANYGCFIETVESL